MNTGKFFMRNFEALPIKTILEAILVLTSCYSYSHFYC